MRRGQGIHALVNAHSYAYWNCRLQYLLDLPADMLKLNNQSLQHQNLWTKVWSWYSGKCDSGSSLKRYSSKTCCINCEDFLAPWRAEGSWTDSTLKKKKKEITFQTKELLKYWCPDFHHFIVLDCGRGVFSLVEDSSWAFWCQCLPRSNSWPSCFSCLGGDGWAAFFAMWQM